MTLSRQSQNVVQVTRRDVLHYGLAMGGVALATGSGIAGAQEVGPVVRTKYGSLRGRIVEGVAVFKGVRYGASTGGANRFRAPQAPANWTGIKNAFDLGPPSPQTNTDYSVWLDPTKPSEDCLFLNVWAPANRPSRERLPVMFWLHGGGFDYGSGGIPMYSGQMLAKKGDVVVVGINHRLNIFGYTYLAGGKKFDDSLGIAPNVGQLDIIAALKWVQENIDVFGGDNGNVTVFGQSGGGAKICTLMAMPSAQKLYHKAIVQSGSLLGAMTAEEGHSCTEKVYQQLKIKQGDVDALRGVSTARLLDCWSEVNKAELQAGHIRSFAPVVDGEVLPTQPWESRAPEQARFVPMIVGTTAQETVQFMDKAIREPIPDDRTLLERIKKYAERLPEEKLAELVELNRRISPGISNTELSVLVSTEAFFWRSAVRQCELKVQQGGAPVYMYDFAWKTPCFGGSWALHGVELPFVFGIPDYGVAWDGEDSSDKRSAADPQGDRYKLTDLTIAAWSNFARTGNPSTPAHPWPAYDLAKRSVMVFDHETRLVNDPRSAARRALS